MVAIEHTVALRSKLYTVDAMQAHWLSDVYLSRYLSICMLCVLMCAYFGKFHESRFKRSTTKPVPSSSGSAPIIYEHIHTHTHTHTQHEYYKNRAKEKEQDIRMVVSQLVQNVSHKDVFKESSVHMTINIARCNCRCTGVLRSMRSRNT